MWAMATIAALLAGPAPAPRPGSARTLERRNAILFSPIAIVPRLGLSLGYDRAVHRHLAIGARLDYPFQPRGAWHLQGMSETLVLTGWFQRALHGFYVEASLGAAHSMFVRQPKMARTALVPGVGIGLRWQFDNGLLIGASTRLQWPITVHDDPRICTHTTVCEPVRPGTQVRLAIQVGYAF